MIPTKEVLLSTIERIKKHVHYTPVLTSSSINKKYKSSFFFKCDNFQKGGSYKIRGATNAILNLSDDERINGVATHSSGNFAQALSIAAKKLNTPAFIVMPENASNVKIEAVKSYGGKVILCKSTLQDRERTLTQVLKTEGATEIHPSNNIDVILGQATMTAELLEQVPDLDFIICPIGGGGVGAGACLACHHLSPNTQVIGAEPAAADDAFRSLKLGKIQPSINPDTIADGLRTQLGNHNFPIIKSLIMKIIRVQEDAIVDAMRLIWERMKIVIEPSSAISLAAVMEEPIIFENKRIGLIITGGNVNLENLPFSN